MFAVHPAFLLVPAAGLIVLVLLAAGLPLCLSWPLSAAAGWVIGGMEPLDTDSRLLGALGGIVLSIAASVVASC